MMAQDKTDETDESPCDNRDTGGRMRHFHRGDDGTHPLDRSFEMRPGGVVETIGGDELQALRVTHGGDGPSFFRKGDFWADLETILANCDAVMLRYGWDRRAGNGRDFPGDRTAEAFSELWYAGKIGFECWNLLNWHRMHGPNEIALAQACYLGRLLTEAEWRAAFKPAIVTGAKQRRHLTDLREGKNSAAKASVAERRRAVAALMRETLLTGGALDKWLARQLSERNGIKVCTRTIRGDRKAIRG
jgi:hypothetical protein